MGRIGELWLAEEMPRHDGLYRPDDTGLDLHVGGPGAYHRDAGQPIPFRVGGPLGVPQVLEEHGTDELDVLFESPLPDGSGRVRGGGGGTGNVGFVARLDAERSLTWIAVMFRSNPFLGVRFEGRHAVFTNDWGNRLTLDLANPPLG